MAVGHAQLPQPVLQSLQLQQHGQIRLQSITLADQIHPSSISLQPMPHPFSQTSSTSATHDVPQMVEELSQQDLKQLFAAWLRAQATDSLDSSNQAANEHVPVQQGTVIQLDASEDSDSHTDSMAFQIQMKQPLNLLGKPATNYALLSATDLAGISKLSVTQGDAVAAPRPLAVAESDMQLQTEQAMLSSSDTMHAAANKALQHLLPTLSLTCR